MTKLNRPNLTKSQLHIFKKDISALTKAIKIAFKINPDFKRVSVLNGFSKLIGFTSFSELSLNVVNENKQVEFSLCKEFSVTEITDIYSNILDQTYYQDDFIINETSVPYRKIINSAVTHFLKTSNNEVQKVIKPSLPVMEASKLFEILEHYPELPNDYIADDVKKNLTPSRIIFDKRTQFFKNNDCSEGFHFLLQIPDGRQQIYTITETTSGGSDLVPVFEAIIGFWHSGDIGGFRMSSKYDI